MKPSKKTINNSNLNTNNNFQKGGGFGSSFKGKNLLKTMNSINDVANSNANNNDNNDADIISRFPGIIGPLFNLASNATNSAANFAIQAIANFLNINIANKDTKTIFTELNAILQDPETRKQFLEFAQNIALNADLIIESAKPVTKSIIRQFVQIFSEIAEKGGQSLIKVGKEVALSIPVIGTVIGMVFLFDDVVKMVQSSIAAGMSLLTLTNGSAIQIKENYNNLKQGRDETTQRITESTDEFNNTNNLQELQKIQQQLNELLEQKKIKDSQNYYKDDNNVPIDKDKQEISTITFQEYQKQQALKERLQQPQNLLKSIYPYQPELPVKNTILPVPDTDNTWIKNNEILVNDSINNSANNSINNNKNGIQRGGMTRKKLRKSYKKYKRGNFSKKNVHNS